MLDARYWLLISGYWLLVTGYWLQDTWYLVVGSWDLVLDTRYKILDTWYFDLYHSRPRLPRCRMLPSWSVRRFSVTRRTTWPWSTSTLRTPSWPGSSGTRRSRSSGSLPTPGACSASAWDSASWVKLSSLLQYLDTWYLCHSDPKFCLGNRFGNLAHSILS